MSSLAIDDGRAGILRELDSSTSGKMAVWYGGGGAAETESGQMIIFILRISG